MTTEYPTSNQNPENQQNSNNISICDNIIQKWKKYQRSVVCISLILSLLLVFTAVCFSSYWRFILFFSISVATLLSMAFSTFGTAVRNLSTAEPNRVSLFPFALTWSLLFVATLLLLILSGIYLEEFRASLRRLGNIIADSKSDDFSFVLTGFSIIITFLSGYVLFQLANYKKGFDEEAKKAVAEINQLKSDDLHIQRTLQFGITASTMAHTIRDQINKADKYATTNKDKISYLIQMNDLLSKIQLALPFFHIKHSSTDSTQYSLNWSDFFLTQLETASELLTSINTDNNGYLELLATDKLGSTFFLHYQLWLTQLEPDRIFSGDENSSSKKLNFEQLRIKVNRHISRLLLNPLFTENYETTNIN